MREYIKSCIYSIIELCTFYKGIPRSINGFKIRFPARWSRYYQDGYEKDTFEFFKHTIKLGDVVLDIGAHIGIYSSPFAQMVGETGKVFCFEPTPSTFKILQRTIKLNKHDNIRAINAAIAEKSGTVVFNLTTKNGEGSNANSLVAIDRTVANMKIKAYSIDDFRKENKLKIDVIKIDVEGAELSVLRGAKETFEKDKPSGILALHPGNISDFGHSLEQIWDCLENYRVQIKYKGKDITEEFFCTRTDLFDVEFTSAK